jgi:hypothetical protein
MKIPNLKIMITSALLLIPVSCMHLGDGHHTGPHHHSLTHQPPYTAKGVLGHTEYFPLQSTDFTILKSDDSLDIILRVEI